ncbi:MAG TPA: ABC-type transport auxiliary lipoprotein family protein [Steroidobacteraceae bacterium]
MKRLPCTPRVAIAAAILLAVPLLSCQSLPALHYYSLAPVSPVAVASQPARAILIRVRHVSLPREMDHLGLTHQLGPTQLAISDNDQWTAPLGVLIQGTITRDLGERLGYAQVIGADALPVARHPDAQATSQAAPDVSNLDLDFVSLAADGSCAITAQVNWTLAGPAGEMRRGSAHLAAPAPAGCPAGLPAALSAALGDLADQLIPQLTDS